MDRPPPTSRQRWMFLLLVGASSFVAFYAFYTSMSVQYQHVDHTSFNAPVQENKIIATESSMSQMEQKRLQPPPPKEEPPQKAVVQDEPAKPDKQETTSGNAVKERQDVEPETENNKQPRELEQQQQLPDVEATSEPKDVQTKQEQQQEPRVEAATQQQAQAEQKQPPEQEQQQHQEREETAANKPLNILVFYGDDWRHDQLGHLNPLIHSPIIDNEIAGKGIRFTHNCVTTSVCGVSRATYYTGQYMSRHGTNRSIELFRPWKELFPSFLKEAGYHIGYIGKGGLFPFHDENYDTCELFEGYHIDETEDNGRHITQRAQDDAIEFLSKRPLEKPFYMTVAFYATHAVDGDPLQYIPMNHSMELYQDTIIPIPITATNESWFRMPYFFNEDNESRQRWHLRFDEPEKHQRMMKNMYRLITEVDTAIGNMLKVLEEQDALNNTLIIFTTDNGNFHSEHGLADKWYPHQESIRVPLLIRDPRMADGMRNTTNDAFTLNVDLAATILSAANLPIPSYYQGRDVSELYLPQPYMVRPWRTEFFYEFPGLEGDWIPANQALVRKEHKYMLWTDHNFEQFFDLVNDPIEDHDVFNETEYQDVIQEMKARFVELRAAAK